MRDGIISEQMKSRLIKAGLPATYEELVALCIRQIQMLRARVRKLEKMG